MVNPLHGVLQGGDVRVCRSRGCQLQALKWHGGWWCDRCGWLLQQQLTLAGCRHAWMDIGHTGLPGGVAIGVVAIKDIPKGTQLINYKNYVFEQFETTTRPTREILR